MNRFLPRLGWALLALLILLLVGTMVARALFIQYLHGEAFRHSLGAGAANALHASEADFSPLDFDGTLVYGENFHAKREDGGGFSTIDADQLRASFDWHGLLRHAVQIDEVSVQRLNISPPAAGPAAPESAPAAPAALQPLAAGTHGWTVDLRKASVSEANWHWSDNPPGGITGTAVTLTPDGQNGWNIEARGGSVRQTGWPDLELDSASMRWQNPTLYISSSSLRNGTGQLNVTGSIETRQSVDLQVTMAGVELRPLLTTDWRQRLAGKLSGDVNVHGQLGMDEAARAVTVSGTLSLVDGTLTALPILDQIGVFTHTERFRQLELTRATGDFTRTAERLEIRNLVVEAEGLIRIEGACAIENGNIDGTFQVGLTPATLQWIPGSQEQVFTDSRDGYRWTTMRLTGPAAHPVDDLTPRLVVAAGNGAIQGVEGTVKKAAEGALDLLLH